MKAFLAAVLFSVITSVVWLQILNVQQRDVAESFSTQAVRL